VLSLELAQQYGKLARLELAQQNKSNAAVRTLALANVAKGAALLKTISTSDAAYAAAQRQMAELMALRQTIAAS